MLSDPIADFLIQVKNGYMARLERVELPSSKVKQSLAVILKQSGYLTSVEVVGSSKKLLRLLLKYDGKAPALTDVERVSKPGRRVYVKRNAIPTVVGGLGIAIVSTPKGLMIGQEARRVGLGGELVCKVW